MKATCSMCNGPRREKDGIAICPHCDARCGVYRCPDCNNARFYEGVGPSKNDA